MSAQAYAAVHLTNRAIDGRELERRAVVLDREHGARLGRRPRRRPLVAIDAWLLSVTRFVTRSPRSLTSAAATGGTRRV